MSSANWSGHISIGLELVNCALEKLSVENADAWKNLAPASEDVRMHLLHFIGAHHGENTNLARQLSRKRLKLWRFITSTILMQAGNVCRRLHNAKPLAERIFDRVRPLPGNLVKSLEKFQQAASPHPPADKLL